LLDELSDVSETRFAIFLSEVGVPEGKLVTSRADEAIDWRNDPTVTDSLIIVGDLERDRAAGLANVPTIKAEEIRQELIDQLVTEAQGRSASAKTVRLLLALKSGRVSVDLGNLADYCDSLAPALGTSDLDEAVSSLWRLKLLPDRASVDVDARRLRENAQLVNELRQSDATTIQRLIRQLTGSQAGNYEAIRLFASTGQREHLRLLRLDAVRDALRSAREEITEPQSDGETTAKRGDTQFLDAVRAGKVDEEEFLGQFADEVDDDSPQPVVANGTDLDWERVSTTQLAPLLEEAGGNVPYAESAGSLELMAADEPEPAPGKGEVTWGVLSDLVDELKVLEGGEGSSDLPSSHLLRIMELRGILARYAPDLPREGVRLFLAAPHLANTAAALVEAWVAFWQSMEHLRSKTAEVGEVLQVGKRLALTDTRVVQQGTDVTAYLLPLHPMIQS
jgi:hypothetical protein